MLTLILIASAATVVTLAFELAMISWCLTLVTSFAKKHGLGKNKWSDLQTMFLWLGEFELFRDAFYHSAVNFTTLGYGDIVMENG